MTPAVNLLPVFARRVPTGTGFPIAASLLPFSLSLTCALAFFMGLGTVMALEVGQVYGNVEGRAATAGVWRPLPNHSGRLGVQQIRTGAGRLELRDGSGSILLNSASQAQMNNGELQLTAGQAFVTGPVQMYVKSYHLNVAAGSTVRVDLLGSTERVAALSGSSRLAYGSRVIDLRAGQQITLRTGRQGTYQEKDPWYLSQITGEGNAVIEALHGEVTVNGSRAAAAGVGQVLAPGQRLRTGAGAWAELGFTGGGYLRLQANSELEVVAVRSTSQGREVLLRLNRGSVWNVVERGQGGYRLSTPVVSTAVRGTVYRVDAGGMVKVFEGEVEAGESVVTQGQQRTADGSVGEVQPDALDALNQSLDSFREAPLALRDLSDGGRGPLLFQAAPLSELWLEVQALDAQGDAGVRWLWPLKPQPPLTLDPEGRPANLEPISYGLSQVATAQLTRLPAGRYRIQVLAQRYAQQERLPLPALAEALSGFSGVGER